MTCAPDAMGSMSENDLVLLDTVRACIENFRRAEIQTGPTSIRLDNLPDMNAGPVELSLWLKQVLFQFQTLSISDCKLKRMYFSSKSEKILKEAGRTEKRTSKVLDAKESIRQSEYERLYTELSERVKKVEDKIAETMRQEEQNHHSVARLADMLKRLYAQREMLRSKVVLPDEPETEPQVDVVVSAEDNEPMSMVQQEPCQEEDAQESSDCQKIDGLVVFVRTSKKDQKSKKSKKDNGREAKRDPGNKDTEGVHTLTKKEQCNPATGENRRVYELLSLSQQAKILDESYAKMRTILDEIITVQDEDGNRFVLHPASSNEIVGVDKNGNITEYLDSDLMLYPDTPENEARKESLNIHGYSPRLLAIMTVICGMLTLSPIAFLGPPTRLFGMRPSFVRSHLSERLVVKLLVDFVLMQVSKSRIADQIQVQWKEAAFSKQHIINIINGMCRVLNPLAQLMRKILLERCTTMHTDDCVMRCLEWQKDKDGNKVREHNNLWGLVSGAHEEIQGVLYLAAETRSSEEFLNQFGFTKKEGEEAILPCALMNLVTDCSNVYHSGVEKLEELIGHKVQRGGCYAHLRRYFRDALENMKLLKVYDAACQGTVSGFEQRLNAELTKQGVKAGPYGRKLIKGLFAIEVIFWLEEDFEYAERAELEERRQTHTYLYVDKLYAIVEELKDATKTIVQSGERNGIPQYKGGKDVPWGTAIVYALNNKAELHAFLHCGDMECSNNRAERMLRPGRCHSNMMEFLSTKSGFMAFAVIMTIFMTCKVNKINPYEYIHWVFANVKIRLEDYRLEISKLTGTTAQLLKLPRPYKKDGKTINLFDKEYDCW